MRVFEGTSARRGRPLLANRSSGFVSRAGLAQAILPVPPSSPPPAQVEVFEDPFADFFVALDQALDFSGEAVKAAKEGDVGRAETYYRLALEANQRAEKNLAELHKSGVVSGADLVGLRNAVMVPLLEILEETKEAILKPPTWIERFWEKLQGLVTPVANRAAEFFSSKYANAIKSYKDLVEFNRRAEKSIAELKALNPSPKEREAISKMEAELTKTKFAQKQIEEHFARIGVTKADLERRTGLSGPVLAFIGTILGVGAEASALAVIMAILSRIFAILLYAIPIAVFIFSATFLPDSWLEAEERRRLAIQERVVAKMLEEKKAAEQKEKKAEESQRKYIELYDSGIQLLENARERGMISEEYLERARQADPRRLRLAAAGGAEDILPYFIAGGIGLGLAALVVLWRRS